MNQARFSADNKVRPKIDSQEMIDSKMIVCISSLCTKIMNQFVINSKVEGYFYVMYQNMACFLVQIKELN